MRFLPLGLLRVSSVIDSNPSRVSRRRRVDLREPPPPGPSSAVVSVMEVSSSRAGVAGGSGLMVREGPSVVSRKISSKWEARDWDLVRVGIEPAKADEAVLAARVCWDRVDWVSLPGMSVLGFFLPCLPFAALLGDLELSRGGERAFSLMGLISSGPGRIGEAINLTDPGMSMSFHFVEEAEV